MLGEVFSIEIRRRSSKKVGGSMCGYSEVFPFLKQYQVFHRDDLDNHVPGPPPQLLIYMRELGRMSFLRETTRTSLLRELQYHLLLILGVGLVVRPASILHQNGFEGTMGNWNV